MNLDEAQALIGELGRDLDPGEGEIRLDLSGPIARLHIDNPRARNAVRIRMMGQLADAVRALRGWSGSALILSAAPGSPVFCSGGHLGEVQQAIRSPERALQMAQAMTVVLNGLLALPIVSVAAIDGAAIGGGAELATATDFRVGSARARIHFVHAKLGIAPGWGGTARLCGHIGARSALGVLARAEALDAPRALELGLFDAVGPDAIAAAEALLAPMLAHPAEAIAAVKAQVQAAREGDPRADAVAFSGVWGGPAHVAALRALLPKGG